MSASASTATATAAAWSTTTGEEIFADKVGVMLARDMSALHHERDIRGRREIDRPVRHRSGAAEATASRPTTGRPAIPTSSAASTNWARSPASRSPATSSSTRRSAAAMTTASISAIAICDMLDRNPGKIDGGSEERAAEDLVRRRPCRRIAPTRAKYGIVDSGGEAFRGDADEGREGRRPADPRSRHRQRRARHRRGRHLGPGARLVQQAGTGGRGRKPGLAKRACARCSRRSTACCARIPKSANTIRRFEPRVFRARRLSDIQPSYPRKRVSSTPRLLGSIAAAPEYRIIRVRG